MQFAADFYEQDLYYRSTVGNGTGNWGEIWHSNSDGSGSGLDADKLDGINSAACGGMNFSLHFHRFHDYNNVTFIYLIADGHLQREYRAGKR